MSENRSVEFVLSPHVSVFGELTEVDNSQGVVVLLHAPGEDLDSMRSFLPPLHRLLLDTVSIDLPGHGLSSGDWDDLAAHAIEVVLSTCSRAGAGVGVVASGRSASELLRVNPAGVAAVALVHPILAASDLEGDSPWRSIPTVLMGDPDQIESAAAMEAIGSWIRAWSMRVYVHHERDEDPLRAWPAQFVHTGAAFIAEQLAYTNLKRVAEVSHRPHLAVHRT